MSAPPFVPPLRADLAGLEPYGAPQLQVAHELNVNENPYAPSPAVADDIAAAVRAAATSLNRYPDRDFPALRDALADYLAAESRIPRPDREDLWAANGSNEIMLQLFQAFGGPGTRALGFAPHYSMYHEYARTSLTEWVAADRGPAPDFALTPDAVAGAIREHLPRLTLLTSPNNPTGTALDPDVVRAACETALELAVPSLIVVDEAYIEFRRAGVPSALELRDTYPNLVVARTMSKAFALAGGRIGYLVAPRPVIDALKVVRLPYHLSAVTQAVALAALSHAGELLGQVRALADARDAVARALAARGGDVAPSDANFVLFGSYADRHAVWQGLLERDVLIREVGPSGWLRVSIGTDGDNRAFLTALDEVDPR